MDQGTDDCGNDTEPGLTDGLKEHRSGSSTRPGHALGGGGTGQGSQAAVAVAVQGAAAVTVAQGANRGCGAGLWWWRQWLVPAAAAQGTSAGDGGAG